MRGLDLQQQELFSYGSLEQRIPADHPRRPMRAMVEEALEPPDGHFDELYDDEGRPSMAPERLLRTQLLMLLSSMRSERQRVEQLEDNLL